jgi:hypothetical protein
MKKHKEPTSGYSIPAMAAFHPHLPAPLELIYKVNLKKAKSFVTPKFQRSVNKTNPISEILVSKEFWLVYKSALSSV